MNKIDLGRVDVKEMLETLGMRNITESDDEVQFSCPLAGHLHGDAHPSAYMNKHTTAWICHGCHAKGNAITFLAQTYNITLLEATGALRREFDSEFKEPVTSMQKELEGFLKYSEQKDEPKPVARYLDETVLEQFPLIFDAKVYLNDRGFTDETIQEWQFGYDKRSKRITIPIRDETGRIVGIKGRDITGFHPAKYISLGGEHYNFPTYEKSKFLFGINKFKPGSKMILCEGELNAISLWQKGFRNAVAIAGSELSLDQVFTVKRHAKSIVLFFDSDNAGLDVTAQAVEIFEPLMTVYIVPDHEGDPAEMSTLKIRQCLNDAESSIKLFLPET